MSFYLVVRGPAGVGKSAVAKQLAKSLRATYISFDAITDRHGLAVIRGEGISAANFLAANRIVLPKARRSLNRGRPVVFDGCFYRSRQLKNLIKNLPFPHAVFSLEAPLKECLLRNRKRKPSLSTTDIRAVYRLVRQVPIGIPIKTAGKPIAAVAREIQKKASPLS